MATDDVFFLSLDPAVDWMLSHRYHILKSSSHFTTGRCSAFLVQYLSNLSIASGENEEERFSIHRKSNSTTGPPLLEWSVDGNHCLVSGLETTIKITLSAWLRIVPSSHTDNLPGTFAKALATQGSISDE